MAGKQLAISLGLSALAIGGAHRLAPRALGGRGVLLTLHRVRPFEASLPGYAPNALLEVTPEFLDAALTRLKELGLELVSLDEAVERLSRPGPRFAALTFDDGYRDYLDHALPVLERHGAPVTLFICPGFVDGGARLWWLELEEAVRKLDRVRLVGYELDLPARDAAEKARAYERVYWRLRAEPEELLLKTVARIAEQAEVDTQALGAGLFLNWREISDLAARPGITIGAHGRTHVRLAHWPPDVVANELFGSKTILEARLGRKVDAFCYPVGDATSAAKREFALAAACGYRIGVTTRPGMLFAEHADHLRALPRVSLNGLWQNLRSFDVLMSGAPSWLWNRGRRLNVA